MYKEIYINNLIYKLNTLGFSEQKWYPFRIYQLNQFFFKYSQILIAGVKIIGNSIFNFFLSFQIYKFHSWKKKRRLKITEIFS